MEWQYTLFIVLAPLSAILSVGMLLYVRRYRASASSEMSALTWLVWALVGWLLLNTLELASPSESATVFWAKISYPFIASTPLAWLAFTLQYIGRKGWLAPLRFVWLCIVPAMTAILALTNHWHSLIWQQYDFVPVDDLLAMQVVAYGPWFWVHIVYGYALVFVGAFLIVRQYFRSFRLYRRQSLWVVIGALIPIAVNLVYILHLVPGLRKDYTSLSFALASMAFMVGIFWYGLFDLKPVARDLVIDNMGDAMLTLDAQDRIVDLNPAARGLIAGFHGQSAGDDLIGQPVTQVLPPWRSLIEWLQHTTNLQTDMTIELDGAQRHYDLRISPLTDRHERLAGRLVVLRDITARKQAEEKLRQYALELEAQYEELDAFSYTVAHDLKNPLSTLIAYSEYLGSNLEKVSIEEMKKIATKISRGSHAMTKIVDGLLLLAYVRKHNNVEMVPLEMEDIVANVQNRFVSMIAETRAQVVVPHAWPTVMGYAPWVEEVWANYLSNALKYGGRSEEGIPPRVELGFDESEPGREDKEVIDLPNSHVRFWVRDNGPGLVEAEQAQVFAEFARSTKNRVEGHGLGLAIVRRIMEKLGGQVGVESEAGQGCTFWFSLPRAKMAQRR
jgi:PAS domain S-box-containing protein